MRGITREEELIIIKQVLGGDTAAFEELVLSYQDKMYSLSLRMTGNQEDAYDMTQEAFLKAYTNLANFRGDSKFSVWLYRLTSNVCIDFLRRRKRKPISSLTYINEDNEPQDLELPDERFVPDTIAERNELREAVAHGMDSLPEEYRQILVLREINGLSYNEIGEALNLEVGTVKSRIFRARKRLVEILMKDGNIGSDSSSNEPMGV